MSTTRRLRAARPATPALEPGIAAIRREMDLPDGFPPEVEAAAVAAAANPRLPALDRTAIPFVTIDPPGAMDLDQALYVERKGDGFVVHYAIAHLAAFIQPGDPVDLEANRRGETLYGANDKIPLHPKALSEDCASLLPGVDRPAVLWTITLDRIGEGIEVDVRHALVRSRERLDYSGVQRMIDAGEAGPMWQVLREVGELRIERERRRGGISLPLPDQEIHVADDGEWKLEFRGREPVEDWNEQISLLTGMAAAHLMTTRGVGLLRTLPEAAPWALERLRRTARALDIAWPDDRDYPDFIRSLDPRKPSHVAMLIASTTVLRGAGYAAFSGGVLPEHPMHSALASTYAHCTAPLRRLVDRYTGELCVALSAGEPPPAWVLDALPGLPKTMADSGRRAGQYERAVIDLAEALVLAPRVGEQFKASVVEVERRDPKQGTVMLRDPAIEARVEGDAPLPLGEAVSVELVEADPKRRRILFRLAD